MLNAESWLSIAVSTHIASPMIKQPDLGKGIYSHKDHWVG